ncbi:MAG TPA: hypothetical protein DEQ28_08790 [Clostridiales bacterium]|nr:hypothetical protein [Clostridiales bacterium]
MNALPKPLDGKAAVFPSAAPQEVLGHLTWFTVPGQVEISRDDLMGGFARHALREALLPRAIEPVDAFRRATAAVQRSRIALPGGRYMNLLVREVGVDAAGDCYRQVVREVVDSRNRRLEYSPAADLIHQASGPAVATSLRVYDSEGWETVQAACLQAEELYARFRRLYQAEALRSLFRRYLLELHSVLVRVSGGVYFVPAEHADELARLGALAQEEALKASWASFPVVDTKGARATIRDAVADDVARLLAGLRAGLAEEPGKRALSTLVGEAQAVLALIASYEEVLSQDLFDLAQGARLVRDAVVQALDAAGA